MTHATPLCGDKVPLPSLKSLKNFSQDFLLFPLTLWVYNKSMDTTTLRDEPVPLEAILKAMEDMWEPYEEEKAMREILAKLLTQAG